MKINVHSFTSAKAKGFTLLELLVAMSVTLLLLGMVTYMTGASMDGYKGSRDKVVAGRQAKEALDAITKDFEAIVARADGSDNMWLYADVEPKLVADNAANTTLVGPANKKITNAPRLVFFTGAPDRYDGDIGGTNDNGGDVSAVGYRLAYRDQISGTAATAVGAFPSFMLYRHIVDPDDTFTHLLGQVNLTAPVAPAVSQFTDALDFTAENVLAENIYELTVTFLVQSVNDNNTPTNKDDDFPEVKRYAIGSNAGQYSSFTISGNGNKAAGTDISGQLVGVELGITVLTERGLVMTEKGGMTRQDIIKDYGIHYTHSVNVPRF